MEKKPPITIKKYANRRLYNTATSSYVTLETLCQMVKENQDFQVFDAKSGEDITRSVLTQIIVEEENKEGQNLLPISFLRQVISFYGDSLGGLVPRYLDHSMHVFQKNEEQMRAYMHNAFDGLFPFHSIEEATKQNVSLFENTLKMFSPFYAGPQGVQTSSAEDITIQDLKNQLNIMQNQLNELTNKKN
jgi:polyhydroxyalkanoate synthesis repressor PhaR